METVNVQVRQNGFDVELFFDHGVWTEREGHSSYDEGYRLNVCKPVDVECDTRAQFLIEMYENMYNCKLKVVRNLIK